MNKLSTEDRAAVVKALVEGCSIRATVRMTGVAKNAVAGSTSRLWSVADLVDGAVN